MTELKLNTQPDDSQKEVEEDYTPEVKRPTTAAEIRDYVITKSNFDSFSNFPEDFLIINDVTLSGVPTSSIRIERSFGVFVGETLRTSTPIVLPKGREDYTLYLSLVFEPNELSFLKLHRIIAEISHNPLTYIYSNKVRRDLGVENPSDNTIFILENCNIRNSENSVGVVLVDLTFQYFNYKPFSNHFWFNSSIPGINSNKYNQLLESKTENISLGDASNYEASTLSIDAEAQDVINSLYLLANDVSGPVPFPASSLSWMYYANELVAKTPTIGINYSDNVGFTVKLYERRDPIKNYQRAGNDFTLEDTLEFPDYNKIYDLYYNQYRSQYNNTAQEREAKETTKIASSGVDFLLNPDSNIKSLKQKSPITLSVPSKGITRIGFKRQHGGVKYIRIADTSNILDITAWVELSKLCYRYDQVFPEGTVLDFRLANYLLAIANKYPNKVITIYSGIRNYNFDIKKQHSIARALDLSVEGVQNSDLFIFLMETFPKGGFGYYPNNKPRGGSQFVHMDCRDGFASWADASKHGQKEKKDPYNEILLKAKSLRSKNQSNFLNFSFSFRNGTDYIEEELEERNEFFINREKEELENSSNTPGGIEEGIKESYETLKEVEQQSTFEKKDPRDYEKRIEWINAIEAEGYKYYKGDPAVQNVFYKQRYYYIDSDQNNFSGTSYPGIVCTGASITFGHRIAPLKLIGQSTSSWQFLGAGNKAGTLVFTYSGKDGNRSAQILKDIFNSSKENAAKFGSIIPDAGAIYLNNLKLVGENSRQNTILTLLNSIAIVITEIIDQPIQEAADTHQLVINFVGQEFSKESYEKILTIPLEEKKQIIRKILGFLKSRVIKKLNIDSTYMDIWEAGGEGTSLNSYSEKINTFPQLEKIYKENKDFSIYRIHPDSNFLLEINNLDEDESSVGNSYRIIDNNIPEWLGDIIVQATKYCNDFEKNLPSIDVERFSSVDGKPWQLIFQEWGANNLFHGRPYEPGDLSLKDKKLEQINKIIGKDDIKYDLGISIAQSKAFTKWLNDMNKLVDYAKRYVSIDKKNFENYFGKEIFKRSIQNSFEKLGECYEDMGLPSHPLLGNIPLSPEFYIYDDSLEDPRVSLISDDVALKGMLKKVYKRQQQSISRYFKNALLGGSYLSVDMTRILEYRRRIVEAHTGSKTGEITDSSDASLYSSDVGEGGFFTSGETMRQAAKYWSPVYYRQEEIANNKACSFWLEKVTGSYSSIDVPDPTLGFLDNILKGSPYIREGHVVSYTDGQTKRFNPWEVISYGESNNQQFIEKVFGTNTNIYFGPNQKNLLVDAKLYGQVSDAEIKTPSESEEEKSPQSFLDQNEDYFTSKKLRKEFFSFTENAIVNGIEEAKAPGLFEDELISAGLKTAAGEGLEAAVTVGTILGMAVLGAAALGLTVLTGGAALAVIATASVGSGAYAGYSGFFKGVTNKANEKLAEQRTVFEQQLKDHPIADKFEEENLGNVLSEVAASTALVNKKNSISLRRTLPTFKIYFIEEDTSDVLHDGINNVRAFDDFYSYSAVQELRISRSRETASDLATIRITNVAGKLLRRRFGQNTDMAEEIGFSDGENLDTYQKDQQTHYGIKSEKQGILAETEFENPFERMILQDGVKVQIRMGYSNNPDSLDVVFLGSIVEISPSEGGKILQIVCQGFGAELDNSIIGDYSDGPIYFAPQAALSAAIMDPSIVNFGRRSTNNYGTSAEARHSFTGGNPRGWLSRLVPESLATMWSKDGLYRRFYKYPFLNDPQDDNIFAPPPSTYAYGWNIWWDNGCIYRPVKKTPWEIFKEHELRHPGYVSLAVPYGFEPRMTMFFGTKCQHYWSKPPSDFERFLSVTSETQILKLRGVTTSDLLTSEKVNKVIKEFPELAKAIITDIIRPGAPLEVSKELGKMFGRYVPFRNFHYFDSEHHILKNEIRSSRDKVYNNLQILYFDDEDSVQNIGADDISEGELDSLKRGEAGVLNCKLDDNIPNEYLRTYSEEFPSCITNVMAERYAQGLFARLLRYAYSGELIVIGDASIKPYDMCTIADHTVNMYGPFEVRSVEHIFNSDYGFISIITPDMCIDINDYYTMSANELMVTTLSLLWDNPEQARPGVNVINTENVAGAGYLGFGIGTAGLEAALTQLGLTGLGAISLATLGGLLAGAGVMYLGLNIGAKIALWTQHGCPVLSTPLVLGGKPLTSVALGATQGSLITSMFGEFRQWWDDAGEYINSLNVDEKVSMMSLSIQESILKSIAGVE